MGFGDITDMYYSSAQPQTVQSLTVILMESAHVGVERIQMTIQHGKVKMNRVFFLVSFADNLDEGAWKLIWSGKFS